MILVLAILAHQIHTFERVWPSFSFKIVALDMILSPAALTFQSLAVIKCNTKIKIEKFCVMLM